jgi:RNA polymerase sigma-70 factor, ECF subfamily
MDVLSLNDEALMRAMQDASRSSMTNEIFSELFRRYQPRVFAWCVRITGNQDRSVDLSQEVFFKAYRHMRTFRGDARFSTWLYAIAYNHCLNSLKKHASEPLDWDDAICEAVPDTRALEPYAAVERNQAYGLMWELVYATLSPLETRVMTMHYGYEVPLAEITGRLALSNPSGAKAYIVSARRKLRDALRQRTLQLAG